MIEYDGHEYEKASDLPDLGSLVCVEAKDGIRNYEGLGTDKAKLPTYDDLKTGSSALLYDGTFLKYEATTKTWIEM